MASVPLPASSSAAGIGWALAAFGGFSTVDAIVKLTSETVPVMQVAFLMTLASFLPVLLVVMIEGGFRKFWPAVPGLVLLRALLASVTVLQAFQAFSRLPLADAYALIFTTPMWVALLSVPLLGEKVGWRRGVAVAGGFVGVLIMIRPGEAEALRLGHLFAAGCAFTAALAFLTTRRIGGRARGGVQLLTVSVCVVLVTAPSYLARPATLDLPLAFLLGFAGIVQGAAQFCIWRALRSSEASVVVPFQYSQLLWATLYGVLIFDAWPEPSTLLGAGVVIASGLYIMRRERRLAVQARGWGGPAKRR
ncbi:MAG: DMT family transporter [Pseudomonadota bacterium]